MKEECAISCVPIEIKTVLYLGMLCARHHHCTVYQCNTILSQMLYQCLIPVVLNSVFSFHYNYFALRMVIPFSVKYSISLCVCEGVCVCVVGEIVYVCMSVCVLGDGVQGGLCCVSGGGGGGGGVCTVCVCVFMCVWCAYMCVCLCVCVCMCVYV